MGQRRLEKCMKIMEELVSFCAKRGSRDIDMNLHFENKISVISIVAPNTVISNDDIEFLTEALHSDRQHEVEECYWCISGEDYFGDELTLAGVMIDSAEIFYDGNILKVIARRNED